MEYGIVASHAGENPEEGVREIRLALGLDPFHPPASRYTLGKALLLADRTDEALAELRWCGARMPDYGPCQHALVVAAVETGNMDEARAALREVRRLGPHWTMRTIGHAVVLPSPGRYGALSRGFQSGRSAEEVGAVSGARSGGEGNRFCARVHLHGQHLPSRPPEATRRGAEAAQQGGRASAEAVRQGADVVSDLARQSA